MRPRNFIATALLVFIVLVLGVRLPMAAAERVDLYKTMDPLTDVLYFIDRRFYKEIDHETLREGAITGMLEALDDRYTEYIPPASIDDFNKAVRGEFVGIGAQVRMEDGWLLIVTPLEDSPAYKVGIEADDQIIAVDGTSTWQRDVNDIIDELTGKPDTSVRVTVQREGNEDDRPRGWLEPTVPGEVGDAPGPDPGTIRFDLNIVRQRIITQTVKGIHREGEKWTYWIDPEAKIGYVRVSQFTEGTPAELEAACRELVDGGVQGMILDLRFNGGGSLDAAIRMADLFLPEGVIVSTQGRTTGEASYARASAPGTLPDFPLVVVVNQSSASASEVVSGALVDNERAIVLGERTFGKGIVQTVYPLPSGQGHLKITEQYYYLPSGRCIQRTDESTEWGVDPSDGFYVSMTDDEIRRMLRLRREEEVIRSGELDLEKEKNWSDAAWIEEHLGDPQLSAAIEAIKGKIADGAWTPTGDAMPEGSLELVALQQEEERRELLIRELLRSERRIEALSTVAAETDEDPLDVIPGDDDLTDGVLRVFDADGREVAVLTITGADLDRWLIDAPVELQKNDAGEGDDGE